MVDVNYLPLSVNTAGRRGVLLVYISVHIHVLPILCCAYGSRKQCGIAAAYWLVSL